MKKGLVQIYTGNGKGKTTAAVGLAVRARSHGLRVGWVSLRKYQKRHAHGEIELLKKLGVVSRCFANSHPLCSHKDSSVSKQKLRKECLRALQYVYKTFKADKFDLLIMDEINICIREGYLKEKEIVDMLQSKPQHLEVILTGRGITHNIMELADLISEIKEVKHPFNKNIKARKGIEF